MIRLQSHMSKGLLKPTVNSVIATLQSAVKLEHSTIPLYLYALYSLDAAKNRDIVNIIQSVVVEEMLHMTLAANVLNALGGSPQIDTPHFIPSYPGPLPGGVESDLIVHLAPFTADQLGTFLQIEQPEDPLQIRNDPPAQDDGTTIGQFYLAINNALAQLPPGSFCTPPRNQVGPDLMDGAVVVTDLNTAQQALNIIIEQGEGSTTSPEESPSSSEPAHYYRFLQIERAAMLQAAPHRNPPWAYNGAPVLFDAGGVYPLPTDPKAKNYPAGSAQAHANDTFNYTYTALLKALHLLFNGANNTNQMNVAIGLMMSLKGQAKAMMAGIPNASAPNTGPSFEYQTVNPGASSRVQ
jgi:hypothetical protein